MRDVPKAKPRVKKVSNRVRDIKEKLTTKCDHTIDITQRHTVDLGKGIMRTQG